MNDPCLIALMGPTASGKTALAIALAKHFNTAVINVDARQIFRELNIGTARPAPEEQPAVPHYFVGTHSITEAYTAGKFARQAQEAAASLFTAHNVVIASGGSTLYYRAWLHGIDEFPEIGEEAKFKVSQIAAQGLEALQQTLLVIDPIYYGTVDIHNTRRLIRALEVCIQSGLPYSSFLNQKQDNAAWPVIKIGLDLPREVLYQRINDRCDAMLEAGLLDEVKVMYPYRHVQALQTVGYREFFEWMDGKCTLEEAINLFKQHTRNYAKRQLTWFRAEPDMHWFSPDKVEDIIAFCEQKLASIDLK